MAGIYILENTVNSKSYVGQTIHDFEKRFMAHQKFNNSVISKAIKKYGWDNFKQYTYYIPEKLLDYFEIEMIKKTNSLAPNGYNLEEGGRGGKPSDETRKKMSESKYKTSWNRGKKTGPRSEETKVKISIGHKGKKASNETKAKMSDSHKGQKNAFGYKHTDEAKAKISAAVKSQWARQKGEIKCTI